MSASVASCKKSIDNIRCWLSPSFLKLKMSPEKRKLVQPQNLNPCPFKPKYLTKDTKVVKIWLIRKNLNPTLFRISLILLANTTRSEIPFEDVNIF